MDTVEASGHFYSPRWGHEDEYVFSFTMETLEIRHGARECKFTWQENHDPKWSGSIISILTNDSIYPPHNIERLIEHLWLAWRNGELRASDVQEQLTALVDYVNAGTHAKPKTDFWRGIF